MVAGINRKSLFGLIILLAMAGHYALLRVPFVGNDFGRDIPEWPLLADLLVTFPLLYYFMFRPSLKARNKPRGQVRHSDTGSALRRVTNPGVRSDIRWLSS